MKKDEMKKNAKSKMLSKLSQEMKQMSREGYEDSPLAEKMKVTVAAKDEEGLKAGLSKAQQIMQEKLGDSEEMSDDSMGHYSDEMKDEEYSDEMSDEDESDMEDEHSSDEDMEDEYADMSKEEIQAKIEKLTKTLEYKA